MPAFLERAFAVTIGTDDLLGDQDGSRESDLHGLLLDRLPAHHKGTSIQVTAGLGTEVGNMWEYSVRKHEEILSEEAHRVDQEDQTPEPRMMASAHPQ